MGADWLNAVGWLLIGLHMMILVMAIIDGKGNCIGESIAAALIIAWEISYAIRNG